MSMLDAPEMEDKRIYRWLMCCHCMLYCYVVNFQFQSELPPNFEVNEFWLSYISCSFHPKAQQSMSLFSALAMCVCVCYTLVGCWWFVFHWFVSYNKSTLNGNWIDRIWLGAIYLSQRYTMWSNNVHDLVKCVLNRSFARVNWTRQVLLCKSRQNVCDARLTDYHAFSHTALTLTLLLFTPISEGNELDTACV